jgi:hypothetical protein
MPIDFVKHSEALDTTRRLGFISSEDFADIKAHCLARMEMGKHYEAPGVVDNRDYVNETTEELLDAINYLCMQFNRTPDMVLLETASSLAHVLFQLHEWQCVQRVLSDNPNLIVNDI